MAFSYTKLDNLLAGYKQSCSL